MIRAFLRQQTPTDNKHLRLLRFFGHIEENVSVDLNEEELNLIEVQNW